MSPKTNAKSAKSNHPYDALGFPQLQTLSLHQAIIHPEPLVEMSESQAFILLFQNKRDNNMEKFLTKYLGDLQPWQIQRIKLWEADSAPRRSDILKISSKFGPYWCIRLAAAEPARAQHHGSLEETSYAKARILVGAVMNDILAQNFSQVSLQCVGTSRDEEVGALVGIELASYRFKPIHQGHAPILPKFSITAKHAKEALPKAMALGISMNITRHLVNLPANALNPKTYSEIIERLFKPFKNFQIDIWEGDKLQSENMGLLLAVGSGALHGPRLVHLRYRKAGKKTPPIALVGKGVTFDSGGLDLKPSSGMRLMKKDMGGSAALVGLAYWLTASNHAGACDIYLALAENAVSRDSFRPGDVFLSRSGRSVEIHNTDAEGRLILADAFDVAINQKEQPRCLIDVATLTGAIKIALGGDIYGLFSNDDKLAGQILSSSQACGELGWRMPLYEKYETLLNSPCADIANASDAKFGGLIASALFLKKFVGERPWAHLDIYAWTDNAYGAYGEPGATGQCVQALAHFLSNNK